MRWPHDDFLPAAMRAGASRAIYPVFQPTPGSLRAGVRSPFRLASRSDIENVIKAGPAWAKGHFCGLIAKPGGHTGNVSNDRLQAAAALLVLSRRRRRAAFWPGGQAPGHVAAAAQSADPGAGATGRRTAVRAFAARGPPDP